VSARSLILITGRPGSGKTTLLTRLADHLAGLRPAGFTTEEIREHGVRKGFRLTGLDGRQGMLAHVDFRGPARVGRYGVDVAGFETFLERLELREASAPLVFIDEIGKMECLSPRFIDLVRQLLSSGRVVVATVAMKGGGFITEVKEAAGLLVEVGPENRERLVWELTRQIEELLHGMEAS
jgi:nucleoside-triphosphatase